VRPNLALLVVGSRQANASHLTQPLAPAPPACCAAALHQVADNLRAAVAAGTFGISFSSGAYSTLYSMGVLEVLRDLGIINRKTKMASAGQPTACIPCLDLTTKMVDWWLWQFRMRCTHPLLMCRFVDGLGYCILYRPVCAVLFESSLHLCFRWWWLISISHPSSPLHRGEVDAVYQDTFRSVDNWNWTDVSQCRGAQPPRRRKQPLQLVIF